MEKNKVSEVLKTIFKVIVTAGALYWVSRKIDFKELSSELINANWWYLFLALCSYTISQIIASSRLNSFFKTINLHLSERYNFRLYQLGLLYNFFLPGGIGGDGYKIYFLKKEHHIKGRKLLSAIFFDRLSGLWALAIITCALIIFMPRLAIPNYLVLTAAVVGTGSYLFFLHKFFKNFAKRFLQTHIKAIGVQSFQVIAAILILFALNFTGKFSPYLLIFLVSSLVSIIPSIGGGIGLRELVMIYGASYLQVEEHPAVLLSLFFYVISLLVASSGIYYIFRPQRLGANKLPSMSEVEQELESEKKEL